MIGNLMPFKDKMIMEGFNRVRMATFRDAEFMSIVLTVTWLSVQTPTTCIIGVLQDTVIRVKCTWAPRALKSSSLSLNAFHSSASISVSLTRVLTIKRTWNALTCCP